MENWQPQTLSWSYSKKREFESCRRCYCFNRFWGQDSKQSYRIFEMKMLTTMSMLRGEVTHEIIADALKSARLGVRLNAEEAKKNITQTINRRYLESMNRLWHKDNRPQGRRMTEFTSLMEHYYPDKFSDVKTRGREARETAWKCADNLMNSDFWRSLVDSDSSEWREIEETDFRSFDLDGIQVYTRIDFAHSCGTPTIIDWKTGAPSDQDRGQLILYSLYSQFRWEWDPEETDLAAVYLYPELKVDQFRPTRDEIDAIKGEVKRSFGEMMELEPAFGPADVEKFPRTQDSNACRWCRFQGLCGV